MKKNIIIAVSLILLITIGVVVYVTNRSSKVNIYYSSAYDEKSLNAFGIILNSTNIIPKVDKEQVTKVAKEMVKPYSVKPKGIYIEYGLLTKKTVIGLSKEAIEANPALKSNKPISDIPVWIITLKGLLPDDYKPDYSRPGKQPLDISSTVFDAMTGKVLFGFGCGKQN